VSLLVQDLPDHFGDTVRHGPGSLMDSQAWNEAPIQFLEKAVFGAYRTPGDLAQKSAQGRVALGGAETGLSRQHGKADSTHISG